MSDSNPRILDEQLELMLAVLASLDRGIVSPIERVPSLFCGSDQYYRFYMYWLHSVGLSTGNDPLSARISDEGRAVVRMLLATRPQALLAIPIGSEAIAAFGPPGSKNECSRTKFEALAGKARRLPFAFVREELFDAPTISLLHRNLRELIPMTQTLWSMAFHNEASRDHMYLWLHDRLDRWTAMGKLVLTKGAQALSQELLALIMLNSSDDPDRSSDAALPAITYQP